MKERGAPLVTTYHPRHKDLISFIKNTFIETKMIRKCLQLCHLLLSGVPENLTVTWLKSKVDRLDRKFGSKKCNDKRCLIYLNVSEKDMFEYFLTKKQCKINTKLN